jgi:hypothetical protein
MNSLETTRRWILGSLGFCQGQDAAVGDRLTLDQTNPLQFRERRKMLHADISQPVTTGEINVTDTVARFHQLNDGVIRDVGTVAEMDIVDIFAQLADCHDRAVRDESAFCKD